MTHGNSDAPFIGITIEALLRPCEIYPLRTQCGHGFVWEWSAVTEDKDTRSSRPFDLFFDCLEDARRHGYEPHFLDREQVSVVPMDATA